jgi:hypothetical protein
MAEHAFSSKDTGIIVVDVQADFTELKSGALAVAPRIGTPQITSAFILIIRDRNRCRSLSSTVGRRSCGRRIVCRIHPALKF